MINEDVPSTDPLGDRLKAQEQLEAGRRARSDQPLMARLDGKAFHTFTRGLPRPYDSRLSALMIDTAKFLVEKTHAKVAYTQSDEISLFWHNPVSRVVSESLIEYHGSCYMFDGKFQKLTSVLASMAGAYFTLQLQDRIPEKNYDQTDAIQLFDCRVWNVPDLRDVFLNFLWRQDDAIKNSISMAAQARFSHKALHGVGSEAKKQLLRDAGHPWEGEPRFFRMGTFVKRVTEEVELDEAQLLKIPEKHRPKPGWKVERSSVRELDLGYIKDDPVAKELFGCK